MKEGDAVEKSLAKAEFSRPLRIDGLGDQALSQQLEAIEAERQALARRFDLLELRALRAELWVERLTNRPLVKVEGRFEAELSQTCVVTLEPVPARVEGHFVRLYNLDPALDLDEEVEVELDEEDPPEPVVDGRIDLGEAVAEELSLALNPYPRAEGAVLDRPAGNGAAARPSPFAVLEALKKGK